MASTTGKDPWEALLGELRAIRGLLEGRTAATVPPPTAPAVPPTPTALDGVGGGLRMLRSRLDRLATAVQEAMGRLGDGGETALRRRELLTIVDELHERVREARHSLGVLAEQLDRSTAEDRGVSPAGLRETLEELDGGLRRSRQALAGLAESLGGPPGERR